MGSASACVSSGIGGVAGAHADPRLHVRPAVLEAEVEAGGGVPDVGLDGDRHPALVDRGGRDDAALAQVLPGDLGPAPVTAEPRVHRRLTVEAVVDARAAARDADAGRAAGDDLGVDRLGGGRCAVLHERELRRAEAGRGHVDVGREGEEVPVVLALERDGDGPGVDAPARVDGVAVEIRACPPGCRRASTARRPRRTDRRAWRSTGS